MSEKLHKAVWNGDVLTAKLLIKNGACVNALDENGYSPIQLALETNNYEIMEILIKAGANVNYKDVNNESLLHRAAARNNKDAILFLHKHGADLNVLNERLDTPLHSAAIDLNYEAMRILIELGAKPDEANGDGRTPLQYVSLSLKGDVKAMELLINAGAYIGKPKYDGGVSPLQVAVLNQNKDVELMLRAYGATE